MIVVILLSGVAFFLVLSWIYRASCSRFEEELTYHSDTLTEQICQNVDITLKKLVGKTVPLTATNERFGPLFSAVRDEDVGEGILFQRLKIRNYLEEMLSMNDDINRMAVVDRRDEIYLAYRDSRPWNMVPGNIELLSLYLDNEESPPSRLGNVVWSTSSSEDGLVLMRSALDTNTMQFCGSTAAEVKNTSLKAIFEHTDSSKVGSSILYDRNGIPIYPTGIRVTGGSQDRGERENSRGGTRDHLYAKYPINRRELKIAYVTDMTERNRRSSDLLCLILGTGSLVSLVIPVSFWLMSGNMVKDLRILPDSTRRVPEEGFDLKPTLFREGDETDVLVFNVQETSGRTKALVDQAVRDREIQQQNQYQLLEFRYHEFQSQASPYFFFNVPQPTDRIVQVSGDKQVSRLICMLPKSFGGNLGRRNVFCQPREELEYSENHLELYKNIYLDRLSIKWDADQHLLHARIPTYILQLTVENSLVRGMEPIVGTCTIWIRVKEEDGCLAVRIWDDGEGIESEKPMRVMAGRDESRHIGIRNMQDRIQMLYGNEYGLSIWSRCHEYAEVKPTLPLG